MCGVRWMDVYWNWFGYLRQRRTLFIDAARMNESISGLLDKEVEFMSMIIDSGWLYEKVPTASDK